MVISTLKAGLIVLLSAAYTTGAPLEPRDCGLIEGIPKDFKSGNNKCWGRVDFWKCSIERNKWRAHIGCLELDPQMEFSIKLSNPNIWDSGKPPVVITEKYTNQLSDWATMNCRLCSNVDQNNFEGFFTSKKTVGTSEGNSVVVGNTTELQR